MRTSLFLLTAILLSAAGVYADLHDPANSADYLIVTTDSLIASTPWISDLAAWRQSHGRTAMVVATDDIWNEFGNGTPSDTVLKEFFHYAREHWALPQLRDVFIIGFHDVVPSHIEVDSQYVSDQWIVYSYFSDVFYAWHPDSTALPPSLILSIGRLPWSPTWETALPNYYQKCQQYESSTEGDWQRRIHLIADYDDTMFHFGNDFSEPLAELVPSTYLIERDYLGLPAGNPWHGDQDEIHANYNSGSFISVYSGHGGAGVWSGSSLADSGFFSDLTNNPRYTIQLHTCYDMASAPRLDMGGIALALLYNPNGGAIGYFANTNISWAFTGITFRRAMFSIAFADSTYTLGDLWLFGQREFIRTYPWGSDAFSPTRQTSLSCMLLGDPGLVLPARPSAIEELHTAYPAELRLKGNYPNPFNASTQIRFELDRTMHVSLRVFDVTGREAAVLIDGVRPAGEFHVQWDAARFSSGMYFAVLQAGKVRQVQKMMLLK